MVQQKKEAHEQRECVSGENIQHHLNEKKKKITFSRILYIQAERTLYRNARMLRKYLNTTEHNF